MHEDPPPPPLPHFSRSGGERDTLIEMLDYYRAVLARKAHGLSDAELSTPLAPSTLTIGGLLRHMAAVEDGWFHHRFAGNDESEPWASAPWEEDPDWEFRTATDMAGAQLLRELHDAVARSRAVVDSTQSLDTMAARARDDGLEWNLRWIMVHMIEEYARHCGHADLIRESIDGATGD